MRDPVDGASSDAVRRDAAAWIARMRGPEAERSRLAFERWRAASPHHRRIYAEMQALSGQAERLGATALGEDYLARRRARGPFAWQGRAVVIACLLVALVAGGLLVRQMRPGQPSAETSLATAVGQIRRLRLADGTVMTLDAASEVALSFDRTARLVRLVRGRARFDVGRDASRPFVVEAGNRAILDRGTIFDVALGRDGVTVALLRGAVEVRERAAGGKAVAQLVPGQVFTEVPGSAAGSVTAAATGADRWPSGMLDYDGARLADVVTDLNRYSARRVRLADPALGGLRVTGVFRASPIEGTATALAAVLKLHLETAANGDLILRR